MRVGHAAVTAAAAAAAAAAVATATASGATSAEPANPQPRSLTNITDSLAKPVWRATKSATSDEVYMKRFESWMYASPPSVAAGTALDAFEHDPEYQRIDDLGVGLRVAGRGCVQ